MGYFEYLLLQTPSKLTACLESAVQALGCPWLWPRRCWVQSRIVVLPIFLRAHAVVEVRPLLSQFVASLSCRL